MSDKIKITINTPAQFLASGFGSGCAPFAPGTFGTLAAVPLWLIGASVLSLPFYIAAIFILLLAGIKICDLASKELGVHDHGGIVWDEFIGFLITMVAVPVTLPNACIGFLLFRFFDIIKPWPIKWIDAKVSGGLGIMLDDVLAGIFASLCFQGVLFGYTKVFI